MKTIQVLFLAIAAIVSVPAVAGPPAEALSACLSDHTTGKDRKDLAKWIFLAMAAHPELKAVSAATAEEKVRTDQFMGRLVTKLISEDCATETRDAVAKEGNAAMKYAFGALGGLAMQELMSNADVTASMGAFEKYMDAEKMRAAMSAK